MLAEHIFNLISDRRCYICSAGNSPLCELCIESEFTLIPPVCLICNAVSPGYDLCKGCYRNFPLNRIYAACMYESAARDMIIKIKAASSRHLIKNMAELIADRFKFYFEETDVLIPLPSSPAANRLRGFDVANLLANNLSASLGVEVCMPLQRIVTVQQKSLNMRQRLARRSESLYRVNTRRLPDKSARIILVDDVMTTGSTLASAARTLRQVGYRQVDGLVLARSPWH